VYSEAIKVPDMASTPGRMASSRAPAMVRTMLPHASSTGLVWTEVAEVASMANLDTSL
jgi:hypothetical protein